MSTTDLRASAGHRTLAFGLVRVEVGLMPAFDSSKSARPTRNNICPEHNCKVKQNWHCEEGNHKVEKTAKAVEYPPKSGQYVIVDESDWQSLGEQHDDAIELKAWVKEIPPIFFAQPYFVFPRDAKQGQPFAILHGLLEKRSGYLMGVASDDHGTAKAFAIGLDPETECILAFVCHHAAYLRKGVARSLKARFEQLPVVSKEHMALAQVILDALDKEFSLDSVADTLGDKQWEYVRARASGETYSEEAVLTKADDLQEQLKASVKSLAKPATPATKKKPSKKKVAA